LHLNDRFLLMNLLYIENFNFDSSLKIFLLKTTYVIINFIAEAIQFIIDNIPKIELLIILTIETFLSISLILILYQKYYPTLNLTFLFD